MNIEIAALALMGAMIFIVALGIAIVTAWFLRK